MASAREDHQEPAFDIGKTWNSYDGDDLSYSSSPVRAGGGLGLGRRPSFKGQPNGSKLKKTTSKVLEKMSRFGKRSRPLSDKGGRNGGAEASMCDISTSPCDSTNLSSSEDEGLGGGKDDAWLYEPLAPNCMSAPAPALSDKWDWPSGRSWDKKQVASRTSSLGQAPACASSSSSSSSPQRLVCRSGRIWSAKGSGASTSFGTGCPSARDSAPMTTRSATGLDEGEKWWTSGSTASLPIALVRGTHRTISEQQCHCPACCRCGSSQRLLSLPNQQHTSSFATVPRTVRRESCPLRRSLDLDQQSRKSSSDKAESQDELLHPLSFARRSSTETVSSFLKDNDEQPPAPCNSSLVSASGHRCSKVHDLESSHSAEALSQMSSNYSAAKRQTTSCGLFLDGDVVKNRMEVWHFFSEMNACAQCHEKGNETKYVPVMSSLHGALLEVAASEERRINGLFYIDSLYIYS